jgi:hypothetical protein
LRTSSIGTLIEPAPTTACGGDWLMAVDSPTERAAAGNASTAIAATRSLRAVRGYGFTE